MLSVFTAAPEPLKHQMYFNFIFLNSTSTQPLRNVCKTKASSTWRYLEHTQKHRRACPGIKHLVPAQVGWVECWWAERSPLRRRLSGCVPSPPDRCGRARPPAAAGNSAWRAGWPAATGRLFWGLPPCVGSLTASPAGRWVRGTKTDSVRRRRGYDTVDGRVMRNSGDHIRGHWKGDISRNGDSNDPGAVTLSLWTNTAS